MLSGLLVSALSASAAVMVTVPSNLGWGPEDNAYPQRSATSPRDGAELVWVPPGNFLMGGGHCSDEEPVHRVTLSGFWLYRHEITTGQFARFVEASGRRAEGDWARYARRGPRHPVVGVTWGDAVAYARWAAARLPTEAEWEYAARGPEGRQYPWGRGFDETRETRCCNADNLGPGQPPTFPVGSFPAGASWCGGLDLTGNVYEWCADWYSGSYYASSPARDPPGPASGAMRVVRGGSWNYFHDYCRANTRAARAPDFHADDVGFRCAISPG